MDFMIGLPVFTNWEGDTYDSILVIIDQLTQIVHYKPVKVIIDAFGIAKVIPDLVVRYHDLSNSIMSDQSSIFNSKFSLSLCYFFGIKQRLSITFYSQTNGQI